MKLIIYCNDCGILLPNAERRGECCACCQAAPKKNARHSTAPICFSRRPSAERILAAIRESVVAR